MIFESSMLVEPMGWARARQTRDGRRFTPTKMRHKQAEIRYWLAKEEAPKFTGAVRLTVVFWLKKPKSVKREFPTVIPDLDNFLKLFCDSANGILYEDDRQVVEAIVSKRYADPEAPPSISIKVEALEAQEGKPEPPARALF